MGFMGVGKTTYGRKLAIKLGYKFIDLDKYIENKYKFTISSVFNYFGEEVFRRIEHLTLLEISNQENVVVATGGGTPCFESNIDIINNSGISIYLYLTEKQLLNRLINAKKKRPLIKDKNSDELLIYITNTLNEREKYYLKAKVVVKALDLKVVDFLKHLEHYL